MDLGSVIWRSSGEDAPQISISRTIVAKIRNARMVSPRGSGSRNLSEQKRKQITLRLPERRRCAKKRRSLKQVLRGLRAR